MNTDTYREDRIHLLETLAKNGLFCDQLLDVESFDVTSCLSKKPFVVRHASPADLPALIHLEETCWKDLQLPSEQILQRISHFPQGQYVALIENTVVAVMYTQRISAIDLLDNVTFPTMSTLHDNHGSIAQLLGVAVLPEFGNMQIANSLRYLVLNAALCNSQVHAAIAMTRCSTSFPNESEYERNAKLANDPILQFHINGGAKFVKITKQFRSNDAVNFGHSIMIRYELRKSQSIESKPTSNGEIVQDASSAVVFNRKIIMGESICEIINQVCGSTLSFSESFMSTPFMDFGLDSLKLMEVRNHLLQLLNNDSQLVTQTVLFDYPTPGRLLKYLNRVTPKDANPPLTSTSSHKRSIDQKYTVCGMSCRFPGGANTPDIFFDMLCKGVHFVKEVPKEWKVSTKVRYANFLDDESASTFDPDFFGVSHSEAKAMDPHQRILLEVVHEALAEAELLDSRDHLKIGVFVGLCNNEWIRRTGSGQLEVNPYVGSGTAQSSAATRISFILGLTGPSLVVDTACSSSLAATHVAMNALKCGDCDVAIVASADLLLSSYSLKVRESAGMLTLSNRLKAFGSGADGYIRGEGAAALVIRPEAKILEENSSGKSIPLYATILGSSSNQNGKSASFTAPNGTAQRSLLKEALVNGNVNPNEVDYIESHGTGTILGDPIEWGAIKEVFLANESNKPLYIGAVKSNIGHLEGAAGIAGMIKAIMILKKGIIPPNLNCKTLNPLIDVSSCKRIASFPQQAEDIARVQTIGVSSFGSGGTNVHMLLRKCDSEHSVSSDAKTLSKVQQELKVAFLFTGQGSLTRTIAEEFYRTEPAFKALLQECSDALGLQQPSLPEVLETTTQPDPLFDNPIHTHLTLFCFEVALARLWLNLGAKSIAMMGHSFGEFAAAVAGGYLDFSLTCKLIHARATAFIEAFGPVYTSAGMAAVRASRSEVEEAIAALKLKEVSVAAVNGKRSLTISGLKSSLQEVVKFLKCSHKFLEVPYPFHNSLLQPAVDRFRVKFDAIVSNFNKTQHIKSSSKDDPISFVSCLTGSTISPERLLSSDYWCQQMLHVVEFVPCIEELLRTYKCNVFIEIGPDTTLQSLFSNYLADTEYSKEQIKSISSFQRNQSIYHDLSSAFTKFLRLRDGSKLGGRFAKNYHPKKYIWRLLQEEAVVLGKKRSDSYALDDTPNISAYVLSTIQTLLGPEKGPLFSLDTPFLDAGIDSLGSIAIRNKLSTLLRLPNLPVSIVLQHNDCNELVETLAKLMEEESSRQEIDLSMAVDTEESMIIADNDNEEEEFATSSMQQGILFHHLSEPTQGAFIESFEWHSHDDVNIQALFYAWCEVIRLFPTLRTEFNPLALPLATQKIVSVEQLEASGMVADMSTCEWFHVHDISNSPFADTDVLRSLVDSYLFPQRQLFKDVTSLPLFNVIVLKTGVSSESKEPVVIMLLSMHHLIIDGVSMHTLLQALRAYYSSYLDVDHDIYMEASSYRAVVDKETTLIRNKQSHVHQYWRENLQVHSHISGLIRNTPWKIDLSDLDVIREKIYLTDVHEDMQSIALQCKVTVSSLYHTLFGIFLAIFTGQYETAYGSTVFCRNASSSHGASHAHILGPMLNTVPIFQHILPETNLVVQLHQIHNLMMESLDFGILPLAEILKFAAPGSRLFSIIFDYQPGAWNFQLPITSDVMSAWKFQRLVDRIGCPLSMRVLVEGQGISLIATSESSLFDKPFMKSLLFGYEAILRSIISLWNKESANPHFLTIEDVIEATNIVRASEVNFLEVFPMIENKSFPTSNADFTINTSLDQIQLSAFVCSAFASVLLDVSNSMEIDLHIQLDGLGDFVLPFNSRKMNVGEMFEHVKLCSKVALVSKQVGPLFTDNRNISLDYYPVALVMSAEENKVNFSLRFSTNKVPTNVCAAILSYLKSSIEAFSSNQDLNMVLLPHKANCVQPYIPDKSFNDLYLHSSIAHHPLPTVNSYAVAAYDDDGNALRISYHELQYAVHKVAAQLYRSTENLIIARMNAQRNGQTGEDFEAHGVVAVVMEKGWEQVVATLSILRIGCTYLPMDAKTWPEQRIRQVLEISEAIAIVTQSALVGEGGGFGWMKEAGLPMMVIDKDVLNGYESSYDVSKSTDGLLLEHVVLRDTSQLAYLIYTSGSTGVPKGVCCHHRGAMNTIADLNDRYGVTSADRVLALSSLSFDLSVYDIFGLLSAGGSVVIPAATTVSPPNPEEWYEMMVREEVTVWNTVPAFMELLVSHAEMTGQKLPGSLRLIFMSGDWIPTTLPSRIRAVCECSSVEVISMGGATEASIWSNIYEIGKEGSGTPEGWTSIPYGRPMRNQRMYILNHRLEHCEEWVTGGIYIGGVGVAHGYYKNEERSRLQFIRHPETGEKLFRTGDLGRVRPGGLLEILGREDLQVKVNGFRIELGEIEKTLMQHEKVQNAVVTVHNNALCAYLVSDENPDILTTSLFSELRKLCRENLTEYMMPQHWMLIDEVPLSANGKVARDKLPSPNQEGRSSIASAGVVIEPKTEAEKEVRDIFAKILNVAENSICCESSTFFQLGGNSLTAIQLLFALRKQFGISITVQDLFRHPTVCGIIAILNNMEEGGEDSSGLLPTEKIRYLSLNKGEDNKPTIFFFNPAGASGMCYMSLIGQLDKGNPIYALDDGVVESGSPFEFDSIEEVAQSCVKVMTSLLETRATKDIILCGWSYGGVVAVEIAKLIKQSTHLNLLQVKSISMFDSPLRAAVVSKSEDGDDSKSNNNFSNNAQDSTEVMKRAQDHFSACTTLLRKYHKRPTEQKPLTCPIFDIRPEHSEYQIDPASVEELTIGLVVHPKVTGNHWTMIYGEHAKKTAEVMQSLWSSHHK